MALLQRSKRLRRTEFQLAARALADACAPDSIAAMSRPFDTSLWARQGAWYEPHVPRRPFAERANQIQYMPWLVKRSLFARLKGLRLF